METISLAINSHKPVIEWLEKTLSTAKGFDEIVLYVQEVDDKKLEQIHSWDIPEMKVLYDAKLRTITKGFNYAISTTTSDWVCSFCDDDWFVGENLKRLLDEIRCGRYKDADVIHFKVQTDNGFSWGAQSFTLEGLRETNQIPHGSFFRKAFFEKIGGYKTENGTDWNFWIRAMEQGARFANFNEDVYHFRTDTGGRSAYQRQLNNAGYGGMKAEVNNVK